MSSTLFPFILILCLVVVGEVVSADNTIPTVRSGCSESCENSTVKIPFPFGIGKNCYYNSWYEVVCNNSSGSQKPILNKFDLEVLNISSCLDASSTYSCFEADLTIQVASYWQSICNNGTDHSSELVSSLDLNGSPYQFSGDNDFFVRGCSGQATVMDRGNGTVGGCSTLCQGNDSVAIKNGTCDGTGCCFIPFSSNVADFYQIGFTNQARNTCLEYAMADWSSHEKTIHLPSTATFPNTWLWEAPDLPGGLSSFPKDELFCSSICSNNSKADGCVLCTCQQPYEGNPYLPYGCQDSCKVGTNHSPKCKKPLLGWRAVVGLSISLGSVSLILCCYGLYRLIKRWKQIKRRAKFFKRNGGLLLQQEVASTGGGVERTKIFTAEELTKATDYFSETRVLGQGGQGTVYKGMLLDGRVVAVKKSMNVDQNQLQQFVNEVVILSQINHRSIVKLLGCCLETEVPLLVYEFVPNGTLGQHIHNPSKDFYINWQMRLQIASESAEALKYLHSYSTMPIYHRDVKSSNILLDGKYRAKVSDFGTSRTIPIDQTHLTTGVQGTYGYLDPEYFRSHQFTDKSDVYSFGVVLVELLTGKKPLSPTDYGGLKSLSAEFLSRMETSQLFDILDVLILKEAKEEELIAIASLAKRCLNLNAKLRPTMKEVVSALEEIRSSSAAIAVEQVYPRNDVVVEVS